MHLCINITVSDAPPIRSSPPKLFHSFTNKQKFHDLVNQNINLKLVLKPTKKSMMPLIIL